MHNSFPNKHGIRSLISAGITFSLLASFLGTIVPAKAEEQKIPVRVVVVTTFELGQDTGDTPGEFQNWVEKLPLNQEISALRQIMALCAIIPTFRFWELLQEKARNIWPLP